MATHSSVLAWRIPGRGSLVGCCLWGRTESDRTEATSLSLFTSMGWRRKWQPTPVFLPGESQMGCHLWGLTESDTTEATLQQQQHFYERPTLVPVFTNRQKSEEDLHFHTRKGKKPAFSIVCVWGQQPLSRGVAPPSSRPRNCTQHARQSSEPGL